MYIIKHNIPIAKHLFFNEHRFSHKRDALHMFRMMEKFFITKMDYTTKTFIRNEKDKPLRGQMTVEVDGFFYYVELFKL